MRSYWVDLETPMNAPPSRRRRPNIAIRSAPIIMRPVYRPTAALNHSSKKTRNPVHNKKGGVCRAVSKRYKTKIHRLALIILMKAASTINEEDNAQQVD